MLYTTASKNCSVNENSGPPKTCTFDIWPVTRKRLPTPGLQVLWEIKKARNMRLEMNCDYINVAFILSQD